MKFGLIAFLFLLAGCGKDGHISFEDSIIIAEAIGGKDPRQFQDSNLEFESFKDEFSKLYLQYRGRELNLDNVPINFGDTTKKNKKAVGVCYVWKKGNIPTWREIIISRKAWDSYNDNMKMILIHHELGHCALGRGHDNGRYKGFAESIMNKAHIGDREYDYLRSGYLAELFNKTKNSLRQDIDAL